MLPPRPKPGRKPSVDTPVSKRKAQNRAAQRAFRERRANRVQELEQKLNELEKENELKELGFLNTITKLQAENKFLKRSLEQLRIEVDTLSSNRRNGPQSASPAALSRPVSSKGTPITTTGVSPPQTAISPLARALQVRPIAPSFPKHVQTSAASTPSVGVDFSSGYAIQQVSPAPSSDSPMNAMNPMPNDDDKSCGICIKDDCLCEEVGLKEADPNKVQVKLEEQLKTFKPMAAVSLRRKRTSDTVQEFDFTAKFASRKPMPDLKKLKLTSNFISESSSAFSLNSASSNGDLVGQDSLTNLTALKKMEFDENSPVENCGFCSDDTPCVCREAAQEAARLNKEMSTANTPISTPMEMNSNALPPLQLKSNQHQFRKSSLPVMHPGPSVEIQSITNLTPGAVPLVVTPTQRSTTVVLGSEQEVKPDEETTGGCTGNPGTCRQCQTDPMSTLFCTTVASKAKTEDSDAEASGEESKPESAVETVVVSENTSAAPTPPPTVTTPTTLGTPVSTPGLFPHISRHNSISMNISNSRTEPLPSVPLGNSISRPSSGIFIPCSDAYKTLSRHEKFNSMDFGTLVGKLTTRGMQVDASSVAKVLRELDKKVFN